MITYSQLGKPGHGNLGNQLFQIASCMGFACKHNHKLVLPKWKYSQYFKNWNFDGVPPKFATLRKEQHFHYDEQQFRISEIGDYDISGWLQSEKYFGEADVKHHFQFNDKFKRDVLRVAGSNLFKKETIAISIRRGDYVDNPNYELLPVEYYISALLNHFPDYEKYNILFFSDDIQYCRVHFGCLPNAYFAERLNDIEQLCLMAECDHFIIANSTFSWWGAYLGEKEGSKIIRPDKHFDGELLRTSDSKDLYPERWEVAYATDKIDLGDCTFTIPVHYDHPDRKQNLDLCVAALRKSFWASIVVGEQGSKEFGYMADSVMYEHYGDMQLFHRTKMLNDMAPDIGIGINWDADVMVPPMQLFMAVKMIRNGEADMVYPYDGRFARVPRKDWYGKISKYIDAGIYGDKQFYGMGNRDGVSVGGAFLYDAKKYWNGGGENEHFISYGPEDVERKERFEKLGYKVKRVFGVLYHLDHYCGTNSLTTHEHFKANEEELKRIRKMSKAELQSEILSWEFARALR